MRTGRFIGTVGAGIMVLAAAGCGGGGGPDAAAVAWTDRVCEAVSRVNEVVKEQSKIDQTDPTSTVRSIGDFFGNAANGLQSAVDGLASAGPAPVAGGDEYVRRLTDTLTQMKARFESARGKLTDVDVSNPEQLAATLPAAVAPLEELSSLPDPTAGLESGGEDLRRATDQAPKCQELRSNGG